MPATSAPATRHVAADDEDPSTPPLLKPFEPRRVGLENPGTSITNSDAGDAHQHPVPLDDVIAAFETVARDSLGLGVDPARVALGGASAGAHLALAAALVLRDAGGPTPAGLFLAYPVTDPIRGHYPEKPPEDCPPVFWIGANMVADLFGTYLGYDPANAGPPAVPAAADVAGLPPTLVTTAYYDSLASQGVAFVEQVRAAGVDVEHHEETSLLHGYLNLVGSLPAADAALARHTTWIQSVLRPR
jgi:acetyl esterase/lipase